MGVSASGNGLITFAKGRRTSSIMLVNAPVLGRPKFVSAAPGRQPAAPEGDPPEKPSASSLAVADTPQERLALMKALVHRRGQRV